MDTKSIVRSIFIASLFLGAVVLTSYQFFYPHVSVNVDTSGVDSSYGWKIPNTKYIPSGQVIKTPAYSNLRQPGGIPKGLPVRIQIPTIGVDTAIEDAYITSDGRMDVPAGSVNVAWYALGPQPGQKGSAVIGGHFGIDNGVPKVFYNLNKLVPGDKVYVIDDKKQTLAFIVRSIKLFGKNADATSVFISNDGLSHLNLITCEGPWNKVNDTYPDRRVVFTDQIPSQGAITVTNNPNTPHPSLPETALTKIISNRASTTSKISSDLTNFRQIALSTFLFVSIIIIISKFFKRKSL